MGKEVLPEGDPGATGNRGLGAVLREHRLKSVFFTWGR